MTNLIIGLAMVAWLIWGVLYILTDETDDDEFNGQDPWWD